MRQNAKQVTVAASNVWKLESKQHPGAARKEAHVIIGPLLLLGPTNSPCSNGWGPLPLS
jgi:hypothetical protein